MKKYLTINILLYIFGGFVYAQSPNGATYQRSSVIQMMIEHPMYMFNEEIANAFRRIPLPNRFNNHNLGVRVVKFAAQEYIDQTENIASFIKQTNLGTRTVAKWFDWNKETGLFDMELVKQRGFYNANAFDRELASRQVRGNAILGDAGERLIPNTYLIMSDICYSGKYSIKEDQTSRIGTKNQFDVKIVSYIFQLDWDEEKLNFFYTNYYGGMQEFIKQVDSYGFIFRAKVETDYSESSSKIVQSALIERVVARCLDINIAKLQRAYPDFRIKALMTSSEPIQADIGIKEGVTEDDLYEVLEMSVDNNGIASYERVGIIRPEKGKIWDNRYMAKEEGTPYSGLGYTTFQKVSGGDFYSGMLIREIDK